MKRNYNKMDIIGKKFGKLLVLEKAGFDKYTYVQFYKCKCDCGKIVNVRVRDLVVGKSKSCGCSRFDNPRTKRLITYKGVSNTIPKWAKELGINCATLYKRLNSGWSVEKAFETPVDMRTPSFLIERMKYKYENNFK